MIVAYGIGMLFGMATDEGIPDSEMSQGVGYGAGGAAGTEERGGTDGGQYTHI